MQKTINFGIDLGTTNSIIAKYSEGEVEVFKNPLNWKQALPSVVAFRKNRIIIGDKAREVLHKDPQNVVGGFKRKMGTSGQYFIESTQESVGAEELSAYILKELKNFIHTGEVPEAAVITIPASFDTMQSNATKKAGYRAGFGQVVLLQEPIAASLAYANKEVQSLAGKKWLVYDLGGGTFDVAVVTIEEEEMKVIGHEGNNYLGGADFDKAIIEQLIIPHLEREGSFSNLEKEMKSAAGRYNRLYNLDSHPEDQKRFEEAVKNERQVLASGSASAIQMKTSQLKGLITRINSRRTVTNEDIVAYFSAIKNYNFMDQGRARKLIQKGEAALQKDNYATLTNVVHELYSLQEEEKQKGTGSFKKPGTGLK